MFCEDEVVCEDPYRSIQPFVEGEENVELKELDRFGCRDSEPEVSLNDSNSIRNEENVKYQS